MVNLLKDRDGVSRMAGRGWQGFGLGLVMLTALAGQLWRRDMAGRGPGRWVRAAAAKDAARDAARRAASSAGDSTADRRDSGKPFRAAARHGG